MSAKKLSEPVCQNTGTITISIEKYNSMQRSIDTLLKTYESSLNTIQNLNRVINNYRNPQPRKITESNKVIALYPKSVSHDIQI